MDVYDFDVRVVFEEFAEFSDVNVHAACVEIVVFYPNSFESVVAFKYAIAILHEESKKFTFFGCEFSCSF